MRRALWALVVCLAPLATPADAALVTYNFAGTFDELSVSGADAPPPLLAGGDNVVGQPFSGWVTIDTASGNPIYTAPDAVMYLESVTAYTLTSHALARPSADFASSWISLSEQGETDQLEWLASTMRLGEIFTASMDLRGMQMLASLSLPATVNLDAATTRMFALSVGAEGSRTLRGTVGSFELASVSEEVTAIPTPTVASLMTLAVLSLALLRRAAR